MRNRTRAKIETCSLTSGSANDFLNISFVSFSFRQLLARGSLQFAVRMLGTTVRTTSWQPRNTLSHHWLPFLLIFFQCTLTLGRARATPPQSLSPLIPQPPAPQAASTRSRWPSCPAMPTDLPRDVCNGTRESTEGSPHSTSSPPPTTTWPIKSKYIHIPGGP